MVQYNVYYFSFVLALYSVALFLHMHYTIC